MESVRNHKSKHNKAKCRKCAYHRNMSNSTYCICNYAYVTGQTCLHKTKNGVEDRRGEDYNDCKLFVKGASVCNESESW